MTSRGLSFAIVLGLALGVAAPAAAEDIAAEQEAQGIEYREIIEQAVAETERENWNEANALFRRAHQLRPSARTLRGLGMVAFNRKEYVDAVMNLSAALEDSRRPLTDQQREQATGLLEQAMLAKTALASILKEHGMDTEDKKAYKAFLQDNAEAAFYHNKVQTAIHFAYRALPMVPAKAAAIRSGEKSAFYAIM